MQLWTQPWSNGNSILTVHTVVCGILVQHTDERTALNKTQVTACLSFIFLSIMKVKTLHKVKKFTVNLSTQYLTFKDPSNGLTSAV